jgi:hypothetical protein
LEPNATFSARAILQHLSSKAAVSEWPTCDDYFERLYKAFDVQGLHKKDPIQIAERKRRQNVIEHFCQVLSVGIITGLEVEREFDNEPAGE